MASPSALSRGVVILAVKPQWLSPGVIAHEQAHNSYALMDSNQETAFADDCEGGRKGGRNPEA